jgi:hypothetical protein
MAFTDIEDSILQKTGLFNQAAKIIFKQTVCGSFDYRNFGSANQLHKSNVGLITNYHVKSISYIHIMR